MYFWLGIFCLKQGFKSSAFQLYPNIGRVPQPVFVLHPLLPHQSFPSAYSSAVLSHVLFHVILTLHQHLPFSLSLLLLYLSLLSSDWPSGLCDPVRGASFLLFPVPGCNLIRFECYSRSLPQCANGRIWLGTRWEPLHGHFKDSDGWFHKQCA